MYPLYDTGNLIHKSTTPAYSYLYSGSVSEVEICRTYDEPKPWLDESSFSVMQNFQD